MTDSRPVTREALGAAFRATAYSVAYDSDAIPAIASAIFDALPATPAASGEVDAAWEALRGSMGRGGIGGLARTHIDEHRPAIEAAIRAESAGTLDAVREFFDAERAYLEHAERAYLEHIKQPIPDGEEPDFGPWDRMMAAKTSLAAMVEYARLAEADR